MRPGRSLEFWGDPRTQPWGGTATENSQRGHDANSIAAIRLSRVIGRSRTRTPSASNTALAIADAPGPWAASPAPSGSLSGREMSSPSTSAPSLNRRIAYETDLLLVI